MKYRIRHETTYDYGDPVQISHNLAHLKPLKTLRQRILAFRMSVSPEPAVLSERRDTFGNAEHFLLVQESHLHLSVLAESDVEILPAVLPDPAATEPWETVAERLTGRPLGEEAIVSQYRHASPFVPLLSAAREWSDDSFRPGRPVLEVAVELMGRIHREFAYDPAATSVATPLAEVLARRRGVCQDFSHALIAMLRGRGLAARYVSGYLETRPPPGKPRLVGADASHAWVQLHVPQHGWIDLDPTNDVLPDERHIVVSIGRDFHDVTPLKGLLLGGGGQMVSVSVDVAPLGEDAPPLTEPAAPPSTSDGDLPEP